MKLAVENGPKWSADVDYSIQLAAFDCDGTVVREDAADSPTRQFLAQVERATAMGVAVGVITARGGTKAIDPIIRPIQSASTNPELTRYHALANGAIIYDALKDKIVEQHAVPIEAARYICGLLQDVGATNFWVNDMVDSHEVQCQDYFYLQGHVSDASFGCYAYGPNVWRPVGSWQMGEGYNLKRSMHYQPRTPLVVAANDVSTTSWERLVEARGELQQMGAVMEEYAINANGERRLQFYNQTGGKANGLKSLGRVYGVDLNLVMACGDGGNDRGMIKDCVAADGIGMAMGNAEPGIKEAATHIAPRQNQDGAAIGLAYVLNRYVAR